MNLKSKQTLNWVLGGLVTALFLFSAMGKFMPNAQTEEMITKMGLNLSILKVLGVVELISALLFLYPRTGVLGTLLLVSYMGGAIATHLEHGESVLPQCIIQAILWIVAVIRFPELRSRILSQ